MGNKTYHIQGNVSNAGDNINSQVSFSQVNYASAEDDESLRRLIRVYENRKAEIKEHASASELARIEGPVKIVAEEIKKAEPDRSVIRESLASLRKVGESAAGSLVATAIRAMLGG